MELFLTASWCDPDFTPTLIDHRYNNGPTLVLRPNTKMLKKKGAEQFHVGHMSWPGGDRQKNHLTHIIQEATKVL